MLINRKILSRIKEHRTFELALLASGLAFGFVGLTSEMLEGETLRFDGAILLAFRQAHDLATPVGPAWLTKVMIDVTALGGITVLTIVTVLVSLYLVLRRSYRIALFVACSVIGGSLLSTVLKLVMARPRPELVPHLVVVNDLSFPSGHAMLSAVTYLTLGALLSRLEHRRTLKWFFPLTALFLTLIIGCSRVFLGVHYPTDVIGGWTAGVAWASTSWLVSLRFLRTKDVYDSSLPSN